MTAKVRTLKCSTPVASSRYIKPALFESLSGYSPGAVETKVARGVWLEGHEYVRAPDGNILVDTVGYELWAAGQRRAV